MMSHPKAQRFIWDDLSPKIVQQAIQQTMIFNICKSLTDGCAFSATARQLEYQIRIAYAQADPCIQINPISGPLFNHILWQEQLTHIHPTRNSRELWTPWELLQQVYGHYHGNGCPSFKNLRHWVKEIYHITNHGNSVEIEKIQEQLSRRMPLIAVINVFDDYRACGKSIYIGKPPPTEKSEIDRLATHAVVIVGDYKAVEGDEHGLSPGIYFLYQDSIHDFAPPKSVLGNGISILHPQVVLAVYYGVAKVPNLLVREDGIVDAMRIKEGRLENRRKEIHDSIKWHNFLARQEQAEK
ncbi:hypothetical protein LIER_40046 [Lithospermum erythrorhizon]|uniref:Peptidase C39-like domain-containing protein n=1 Tax=Lithospermum erythrorhizon TaxID=34254 RepID=A0AAV3QSU5_LITER